MPDTAETTSANLLSKAGYATCISGKWQLGNDAAHEGTPLPVHFGFDEFCLWQHRERGSRYWKPTYNLNGTIAEGGEDEYGSDIFSGFLLDFIRRNSDRPFLAYYPMVLPHRPFEKTPLSRDPRDRDEVFADMVGYVDALVGRIEREVEALGIADNTLIMSVGDNGCHNAVRSRVNGVEIRGGKGMPGEAETHVPFIAKWKGVTSPGRVWDDLVDFSDFLPTIVEACRSQLPSEGIIDGRSFLPQFRGDKGAPRDWFLLHYRKEGRNPEEILEYVRGRQYKLYDIVRGEELYGKRSGMLFDAENDMFEKHPIMPGEGSAEAEAARKELEEALRGLRRPVTKL